ncbi:MAG: DNA repair protein RecO [Verrucomicrobiota bacterium]|nr:DNA repair protein RecO [Verrucomicrobiota bacterium]
MSVERATGLVLRTLPFAETSLIVRWLTPSWGRISTIAKGARRPKSPFRGKLDLFYEADFTFNRSRSSALHILREVAPRDIHAGLRKNYHALCRAAYCARLIERIAEEETAVPALYDLLRDALKVFASNNPNPLVVLAFELKLLTESGLSPDWSKTGLRPAAVSMAEELSRLELASVSSLQPAHETQRALAGFLNGFLNYHLGRLPSGWELALLE